MAVVKTRPPSGTDTRKARHHHRCGAGPPAYALISWILLQDPGLRSALEYVATNLGVTRSRSRALRRRAMVYTTLLALTISLVTRVVLTLV